MKVEGIEFNAEVIRSMKKKDFIDENLRSIFLDRSEPERKKLLSNIYDDIVGVSSIDKVEVDSGGGGL